MGDKPTVRLTWQGLVLTVCLTGTTARVQSTQGDSVALPFFGENLPPWKQLFLTSP